MPHIENNTASHVIKEINSQMSQKMEFNPSNDSTKIPTTNTPPQESSNITENSSNEAVSSAARKAISEANKPPLTKRRTKVTQENATTTTGNKTDRVREGCLPSTSQDKTYGTEDYGLPKPDFEICAASSSSSSSSSSSTAQPVYFISPSKVPTPEMLNKRTAERKGICIDEKNYISDFSLEIMVARDFFHREHAEPQEKLRAEAREMLRGFSMEMDLLKSRLDTLRLFPKRPLITDFLKELASEINKRAGPQERQRATKKGAADISQAIEQLEHIPKEVVTDKINSLLLNTKTAEAIEKAFF